MGIMALKRYNTRTPKLTPAFLLLKLRKAFIQNLPDICVGFC